MTHVVVFKVDLMELFRDKALPLLAFALHLLVLHEDVEDEGASFEAQVVAGEVEEFEEVDVCSALEVEGDRPTPGTPGGRETAEAMFASIGAVDVGGFTVG